tara:strand:+ start:55 stop:450 length:396 start_codon:yes stop_codon:yes gene_type:complete
MKIPKEMRETLPEKEKRYFSQLEGEIKLLKEALEGKYDGDENRFRAYNVLNDSSVPLPPFTKPRVFFGNKGYMEFNIEALPNDTPVIEVRTYNDSGYQDFDLAISPRAANVAYIMMGGVTKDDQPGCPDDD